MAAFLKARPQEMGRLSRMELPAFDSIDWLRLETVLPHADLSAIFNAAADVLGRAVVHAVLESKQVGNSRMGYCQQYPSACVKRAAAGK